MRKVNIEVSDIGLVDVKFEGGHLTKREILRIIKALKVSHRNSIREYRRDVIKSNLEKEKEKENDARRTESSGRSQEGSGVENKPTTEADRRPDEGSGSDKVGSGEGKPVVRSGESGGSGSKTESGGGHKETLI